MKTRDVKVNLEIKTTERLQSLDSGKISAAPGVSTVLHIQGFTLLVLGLLGHFEEHQPLYTADKRIKLQGDGLND